MGASKRIMEDLIFSYSDKFVVTTARFANVAFSNGSLPAGFIERLNNQQPISAPKDVKRYFVSPQESGQICVLACILGNNREIFFPKLEEAQMIGFDEIAEQFGSEIANYVQEITNNRDEVKRLGKEEYINQELENLSHPALFVKLCDILYNCLDYPSDSQLARMSKNIDHLISHRQDLTDREWELIEAIPVV